MKNHLETNTSGTAFGMEQDRYFAGSARVADFPIHIDHSTS
jgi:hypothetical protein